MSSSVYKMTAWGGVEGVGRGAGWGVGGGGWGVMSLMCPEKHSFLSAVQCAYLNGLEQNNFCVNEIIIS